MTGNQPGMRTLLRGVGLLCLTVLVPSGASCSAQVLAFDGSDAATPRDGAVGRTTSPACNAAATETLAVDSGMTIATLADAQACALCAWLVGEFESVDSDEIGNPGQAPGPSGFATGPSMGCSGSSGAGLVWTGLPIDTCVENLRASPCAGTVGDLSQCIRYFASTHDPKVDPNGTCPDLEQSCSAFTGATSCGSTVLLASTPTGSSLTQCYGALPITPDASCSCGEGC